jgi:hypothetical protein
MEELRGMVNALSGKLTTLSISYDALNAHLSGRLDAIGGILAELLAHKRPAKKRKGRK